MLDRSKSSMSQSAIDVYADLPFLERRRVYRKLSREDRMRLDRALRDRKNAYRSSDASTDAPQAKTLDGSNPLSPKFIGHLESLLDNQADRIGIATRDYVQTLIAAQGHQNV